MLLPFRGSVQVSWLWRIFFRRCGLRNSLPGLRNEFPWAVITFSKSIRIVRSSLELKAAAFSEFSKRNNDFVGVVVFVLTISVMIRVRGDEFGVCFGVVMVEREGVCVSLGFFRIVGGNRLECGLAGRGLSVGKLWIVSDSPGGRHLFPVSDSILRLVGKLNCTFLMVVLWL